MKTGVTSYGEEKYLECPREPIKTGVFYRFDFIKLEINGTHTLITLKDGCTVISVITKNVIIECLPSTITCGQACVLFYEYSE